MARTRRSRRYYRRNRKSWSSRITEFSGSQSAAQKYIIYQNICSNPSQDNLTVSNLYTVKNIDCQFELSCPDANMSLPEVENLQFYVMYVPQGYIPTGVPSAYAGLPFDHPEWIMAHRFVGSPTSDANQIIKSYKIKTRLARKLDTGDRVILLILGDNVHSPQNVAFTLAYQGLVKYVTRAN